MRLLSNKSVVIWLFGLSVASFIWLLSIMPSQPLRHFNTMVFDTYQVLKPRPWGGSDVVVVDLDETSIKRVGQWPWPRNVVADLTQKLGDLGAAAIVFDIVFSEEDRTSPLMAIEGLTKAGAQIQLPEKVDVLDNDAVLASVFKRYPVVTGFVLSEAGTDAPPTPKAGTGQSGTIPDFFMKQGVNSTRNLTILDDAASGTGTFNFATSEQRDAVVRRVPLMQGANNNFYPTLAVEALRVVQGAGGFKIKSSDGSGELSGGKLSLVSLQVGALEIPTAADGAMEIYHSHPEEKPTVSAKAVLFPKEFGWTEEKLSSEIANHIVLIGTSAAGLLDLRATPLNPVVAGVTVHADILDQIVTGTYISRPDYAQGVELTFAIVLTLLLLAFLPRLNATGDAVLAFILIALVIAAAWYAFTAHKLLFSPIVPVLSLLAAYGAGVGADLLITEKESKFVREAFSHYLSPTMVTRLAENPDALKLGGEDKELTLLFCDIRGFTSLSEGLDPTELTELLNDFLTPMTDALMKEGATIDKYMGDAIMAFWNAPIDQADHRERAIRGLMAMRKELVKLNQNAKRAIDIGIGLNTGPCCVGNLGSTQRFNYSAIGDAVNVASRIEGLTKQYGLDNLIAEETLSNIADYAVLEIDRVGVVGRSEPLTVFTILGDKDSLHDPLLQKLTEHHEDMLAAYRNGDIEQAMISMARAGRCAEELSQSKGIPPLLKLYALYAERFADFRENGIPENWDGVYRSTSK